MVLVLAPCAQNLADSAWYLVLLVLNLDPNWKVGV
jgi:hypothetical protein